MLEYRRLHLVDCLQLQPRHIVLVHVQKDVLYHNDTKLLFRPNLVQLLQEVFVREVSETSGNGAEQLYGGFLDIIIKHLAMLMEHKTVGSAI